MLQFCVLVAAGVPETGAGETRPHTKAFRARGGNFVVHIGEG
ncbi:MAG: hypothetical protein WKF74_05275 [Pyrinomonadaceae bacterium]